MNEKHRYMFIFSDESSFDTVKPVSFKDGILMVYNFGVCSAVTSKDTFPLALNGMPDEAIDEIINLINMFIYTKISEIYVIADKIY